MERSNNIEAILDLERKGLSIITQIPVKQREETFESDDQRKMEKECGQKGGMLES